MVAAAAGGTNELVLAIGPAYGATSMARIDHLESYAQPRDQHGWRALIESADRGVAPPLRGGPSTGSQSARVAGSGVAEVVDAAVELGSAAAGDQKLARSTLGSAAGLESATRALLRALATLHTIRRAKSIVARLPAGRGGDRPPWTRLLAPSTTPCGPRLLHSTVRAAFLLLRSLPVSKEDRCHALDGAILCASAHVADACERMVAARRPEDVGVPSGIKLPAACLPSFAAALAAAAAVGAVRPASLRLLPPPRGPAHPGGEEAAAALTVAERLLRVLPNLLAEHLVDADQLAALARDVARLLLGLQNAATEGANVVPGTGKVDKQLPALLAYTFLTWPAAGSVRHAFGAALHALLLPRAPASSSSTATVAPATTPAAAAPSLSTPRPAAVPAAPPPWMAAAAAEIGEAGLDAISRAIARASAAAESVGGGGGVPTDILADILASGSAAAALAARAGAQPAASFCCDVCGATPIPPPRWHCGVCADYDLCNECYMAEEEDPAGRHLLSHPMDMIVEEIVPVAAPRAPPAPPATADYVPVHAPRGPGSGDRGALPQSAARSRRLAASMRPPPSGAVALLEHLAPLAAFNVRSSQVLFILPHYKFSDCTYNPFGPLSFKLLIAHKTASPPLLAKVRRTTVGQDFNSERLPGSQSGGAVLGGRGGGARAAGPGRPPAACASPTCGPCRVFAACRPARLFFPGGAHCVCPGQHAVGICGRQRFACEWQH